MRQPSLWNIFTDESRQSTDRFMVLGGLAMSRESTVELAREIASLRNCANLWAEMKWTKVSRSKLPVYIMLADIIARHIRDNGAAFHCMTVDRHILDFRTYHEGDRDRGFSVLYYNLLLHAFGRRYGRTNLLHAYLDYNDSKTSADELRKILNNGWGAKYVPLARPFHRVRRVNSKDYDLIQAADVLLGAIGWHKNKRHLDPSCSTHKCQLAEHIAASVGVRDLGASTPMRMQSFTVWHWAPKKVAHGPSRVSGR